MPKSISIAGPPGKPGEVYYPLTINDQPASTPSGSELLISMRAVALNHRDLFIRQHLYPGTTFAPVPLGADGCGIVVSCGPDADGYWKGKRVMINPGLGWRDDPQGPEAETGGTYRILGGTKLYPQGTFGEVFLVDQSEVEIAPEHLSDGEAASIPLTGLTAWRACGEEKLGARNRGEGKDVLVTGIGGGVALMALGFLVKMGTRVWVTSGSQEKIDKAVNELGASGGVNYKEHGWEKRLIELVKEKSSGKKAFIDGIIDGAGGDVVDKGWKILKPGGVIVVYGMTVAPKMQWLIQAVLKNIELKGSTMGSRKEFGDMISFLQEKKIRPVVSRTVSGLSNLQGIEGLFEDMKKGSQFGKLVIKINGDERVNGGENKL